MNPAWAQMTKMDEFIVTLLSFCLLKQTKPSSTTWRMHEIDPLIPRHQSPSQSEVSLT